MYPVSERFLQALRRTHFSVVYMEVLVNGEVFGTLDGSVRTAQGAALQGYLTIQHQQVRRSAEIDVVDIDGTLTAATPFDPLAPFGNEVRVWKGIRYGKNPDGTFDQEFAPIGTMGMYVSEDMHPSIHLSTFDRANYVSLNKFTKPYNIPRNTNVIDAITDLLKSRMPDWMVPTDGFNFPSGVDDVVGPVTYTIDDDPWVKAQAMATTIGYDLFFDPMGVATMRAEVDMADTDPVFDYSEGKDAIILKTNRVWDTQQSAYNGVVVNSIPSGNEAPLHSEVWDVNPLSPTFAGFSADNPSKFGRRPFYFSSPLIKTQTQCDTTARTIFIRVVGISDQVRFPSVSNPAHDTGDVIYIRRAASQIDQKYVLDQITMPFSGKEPCNSLTRTRSEPQDQDLP